eukprot:m.14533 g.14533  ORF g.14533 m.14533 type:complete len:192 (+) comp25806_c0_seq1:318-893(+)
MDNLRPLTNEDTVQVQEICKGVFNGVDYLPGRITSWLKDENIHSLGLDLNGTLIGTISAELDDDRKVAVLKGLRVRSGYRSRGHGSLLTSAMMDFVQKAFPTVQRFVTTEDADGKLKATADWKEIFRRVSLMYKLSRRLEICSRTRQTITITLRRRVYKTTETSPMQNVLYRIAFASKPWRPGHFMQCSIN